MTMRLARSITVGLTAAGLALTTLVSTGQGATSSSVMRWDMNEPSGASTMVASAGGLDGDIGAEVKTGRRVSGATNYGFPYVRPNTPPARPEHLVVVPEDDRMDPGAGSLAVTIRYRTKQNFGNLIQKGQARTSGGYWKFQMPSGKLQCLFRGSDRSVRSANSKVPLNDGTWHTVTCLRTPDFVRMTVDGKVTKTRTGPTGTINNSKPLTIAGKQACDQVTTTCDYFTGGIDYVQIEKL